MLLSCMRINRRCCVVIIIIDARKVRRVSGRSSIWQSGAATLSPYARGSRIVSARRRLSHTRPNHSCKSRPERESFREDIYILASYIHTYHHAASMSKEPTELGGH
ncbi:hypothetical protein XA68_16396 [Ophiocordyceps unilateralis]|uniref:Uncharacterized protein n=1 Tax=Ophiocordyceps unilateralis TaxID=268505 RepID=A0A2A9P6P3_OPHUN|nr:hypothetical protein XA68_16396 [Ophiocordyceps unilateralis]